jgi:Caspase domain
MSDQASNSSNNTNQLAVLIGINNYPNLPSFLQLRGYTNDVEVMADILQNTSAFQRATSLF